jgi:hypothetical protein
MEDFSGALMYFHAKRFVILSLFVLAGVPLTLLYINYARAKVVYDGDLVSEQICRECTGTGKWVEMEGGFNPLGGRCPACGGDGIVEVILPGPNRPTRIQGIVVERDDLTDFSTYRSVRPPLFARGGPPPNGARGIPGARVVFAGPGEPIEIVSNPLGLFNAKLRPGKYQVTIESPRHTTLESELEVPILTEAIWLEDAMIIRELSSTSEAQARYGFEILIGLTRPNGGRGVFISCFGGP